MLDANICSIPSDGTSKIPPDTPLSKKITQPKTIQSHLITARDVTVAQLCCVTTVLFAGGVVGGEKTKGDN